MKKKSILLTSIVLALCALLLSPMPAKAQGPDTDVFIVDTFDDLVDDMPNGFCSVGQISGGFCSLRAAVTEAFQVMVVGRNLHIQLPYGTYVLTQDDPSSGEDGYYGDLDFKDLPRNFSGNELTVTIEGMGDEPSVIDANEIDRVLEIGKYYNVILKNLVITGGKVVANYNERGKGGGILKPWNSTLELNKVRITDNEIVCDNCISSSGGGIASLGKLTIKNSEIDHNTARVGSAISHGDDDDPLFIYRSSIHSNYMNNGRVLDGWGLLLNLVNSTMEGEIHWRDGDVWIQNSTLRNRTQSINAYANISMNGNSGLLYLKIKNSILITQGNNDPTLPGGPNCDFGYFYITKESFGGNVFSDNTCPFDYSQDIRVDSPLDARLGPLQNNGGRTPTRALLHGSPAIDIRNGPCYYLKYLEENPDHPSSIMLLEDQRGAVRWDFKCDSGAFEYWPQVFLPIIAK